MSRAPKVDHNLCKGHGICYDVCPADPKVYEIKGDPPKAWVVNPESCIECESCVANCPEGAIELVDIEEAGPKPES